LLIVCESLRDLNAFHPPFFTLRQIPKQVSISIAKTATYIKGFTGEITAKKDEQIKSNLVFIIQKVVLA
jgi:hypothetical protein